MRERLETDTLGRRRRRLVRRRNRQTADRPLRKTVGAVSAVRTDRSDHFSWTHSAGAGDLGFRASPRSSDKPLRRGRLGGTAAEEAGPEVGELIDEAHIGPHPLTSALDNFIHRVEIEIPILVEAVCNHQRGRAAGTQLAMHEHLLAFRHTRINQFTQGVQVVQDFRVMIPTNMNVFGSGLPTGCGGGIGLGLIFKGRFEGYF